MGRKADRCTCGSASAAMGGSSHGIATAAQVDLVRWRWARGRWGCRRGELGLPKWRVCGLFLGRDLEGADADASGLGAFQHRRAEGLVAVRHAAEAGLVEDEQGGVADRRDLGAAGLAAEERQLAEHLAAAEPVFLAGGLGLDGARGDEADIAWGGGGLAHQHRAGLDVAGNKRLCEARAGHSSMSANARAGSATATMSERAEPAFASPSPITPIPPMRPMALRAGLRLGRESPRLGRPARDIFLVDRSDGPGCRGARPQSLAGDAYRHRVACERPARPLRQSLAV